MLTKLDVKKLIETNQRNAHLNALKNITSDRIIAVIHNEIDNEIKVAISKNLSEIIVNAGHFRTLVAYRSLLIYEINDSTNSKDELNDFQKSVQTYASLINIDEAIADVFTQIFGKTSENEFPELGLINSAFQQYYYETDLQAHINGDRDKTLTIRW